MFDRDLILDKFNSLHHQAKNLLLRFKSRVIERCAEAELKGRIDVYVTVRCSMSPNRQTDYVYNGVSST
jgi:hypothetical protein